MADDTGASALGWGWCGSRGTATRDGSVSAIVGVPTECRRCETRHYWSTEASGVISQISPGATAK